MAGRVPPHYSFPPPPLGRPRLALQLRQLRHIFYWGGIGGGNFLRRGNTVSQWGQGWTYSQCGGFQIFYFHKKTTRVFVSMWPNMAHKLWYTVLSFILAACGPYLVHSCAPGTRENTFFHFHMIYITIQRCWLTYKIKYLKFKFVYQISVMQVS